ncbi:MAG: ABC transporter ATP-binding protein [Roseburia sp.]|nr:ABC transporter ATP-binding protein [Anaeroplasma bactoclasticum]MCM1195885.1 ABC transporter ATP-binding protein [Roseburia sp.]MCM1556230.1 ABC transporter ATP-binding protein [Anaeroplasma bactoclasticum]
MLEILDLYKKYKTKESQFELNIDLKIPSQSFVVITGESGAGKSTFAKILAGLISMNHGIIKLNGEDITSNLKSYVEYLEANEPLIDNFTVYQTLYAKCFHLYDENEVKEKIESICSSLKLTNLKDQKIIDLSGGESQRVAVGCMLLSSKPILVLDEATHSLDENNAAIIINILKEIKNKMVIYITHKVDEVEGIGDIYCHFDKGRITETKKMNQIYDQFVEVPSYNKTKVFSIVKNSFFTGIRGHLQTSISYLILFFLCSCFFAIGTFCTSINNEEVLCSPKTEYAGSEDSRHDSYGVCKDATRYYVEVHSSYNRKIYQDEIEELKIRFKPVGAIENHYSPSYQMLTDENGLYNLHLGAFQKKDVLVGRLYRNKKEAVLAINETKFYTEQNYFKSFIGKRYGEYTIVGIVQTPHDNSIRNVFYASKEDFESFKASIDNSQIDSFLFYAYDVNVKKEVFSFERDDFLNCVIDNSLSNDTIATSKITDSNSFQIVYNYPQFYSCAENLNCIPSEHILSMNQSTYDKFADETMIPCTYFYFNTFEECENFIKHLKSENISFTFTYYQYNQTIQLLSYIGAFILIIVVYVIVGIINRRLNRNRDLFYSKCNYNKKKLWFAKIMSSTILALISLGIYAVIYALLSQVKYTSVIMYYGLRWMTVANWFILLGLALILHIGIEMILQSIPRKRLR